LDADCATNFPTSAADAPPTCFLLTSGACVGC
jgi:hypothetical protein